MGPSRLNACRLVAIVCLCVPIWQPAWGYGWTGHWRVLEAAWPSISAGACDGQPNPRAVRPIAPDLARHDVAVAAGLGAVISDIGYITQGTGQFSDLMHYVGTGNYIDNLVKAACERYGDDPAMMAFLVGVRSHYWADRVGHHEGTNVAVAALSEKNRDRALERVVYEMDMPMHKRLELGAFTVYDLGHGVIRVATSFITGGAEKQLVERARSVLRQAAEMTYGKAGAELVPDFVAILAFMYHVSESVCQTALVTYGKGSAPVPDQGAMLDACKKMAQTPKPESPQKDPAAGKLAVEGIKLVLRPKLKQTYDASIEKVTDRLRHAGKGPLANYNLDTNLPSVGGQYQHADIAYQRLHESAKGSCDPAHPEAIVRSALTDWRSFQPAGICVRNAASEPMRTLSCAASPPSAAQSLMQRYWLRDLAPQTQAGATAAAPASASAGGSDTCRTATFRWNRTVFRMDAQCVLSAEPAARAIEFMLACPAARRRNPGRLPMDALDRLRLPPRNYCGLDPATGLYPTTPCL